MVTVNDAPADDANWSGVTRNTQAFSIAANQLQIRGNQIKINSAALPGDVLYFNKIAITYPRRLSAANDFLEFSINQENPAPVAVTGFTQNTVRVFDITNPENPFSGFPVRISPRTQTALI